MGRVSNRYPTHMTELCALLRIVCHVPIVINCSMRAICGPSFRIIKIKSNQIMCFNVDWVDSTLVMAFYPDLIWLHRQKDIVTWSWSHSRGTILSFDGKKNYSILHSHVRLHKQHNYNHPREYQDFLSSEKHQFGVHLFWRFRRYCIYCSELSVEYHVIRVQAETWYGKYIEESK